MSTFQFVLLIAGAGVLIFFLVALVASFLLNRALEASILEGGPSGRGPKAPARPGWRQLRHARGKGAQAAMEGRPNVPPYPAHEEALRKAWLDGHALARRNRRTRPFWCREQEHEKERGAERWRRC